MRPLQGFIPQKITIISNGTKEIEPGWDDIDGGISPKLVVTPAFVADSNSEAILETGRNWAAGGYRWGNDNKNKKVNEVNLENKPRSDYKVVDLEHRSEGGRAYKVIDSDGYYFDLREDVLLDTILNSGIKAGGELNGNFLWARLHTQMRLVREGSALHEALIEATKRSQLKKVGKTDLQVGSVYRNKKGETFVFCGYVDTVKVIYPQRRRGFYSDDPKPEKFEKIKKAQLWQKLADYRLENFGGDYQKTFEDAIEDGCYFHTEITKEKNVVEHLGNVSFARYDNIIEKLKGLKAIYYSKAENNHGYNDPTADSDIANMVAHGQPLTPHPEYVKILETLNYE